jgi:hypothetical protein
MSQRNNFRFLQALALAGALALVPTLSQAAPWRDDGGAAGGSIQRTAAPARAIASAWGWGLWSALINAVANNGVSIDPNGGSGHSQVPARRGAGASPLRGAGGGAMIR